jgi:hypothetical protein
MGPASAALLSVQLEERQVSAALRQPVFQVPRA